MRRFWPKTLRFLDATALFPDEVVPDAQMLSKIILVDSGWFAVHGNHENRASTRISVTKQRKVALKCCPIKTYLGQAWGQQHTGSAHYN